MGVPTRAGGSGPERGDRSRSCADARRRVHPLRAGRAGPRTRAASCQRSASPPRHVRPHGLAPDSCGGGRVRIGRPRVGLQGLGGAPARFPALRRAVGKALAGRDALRGHCGLFQRLRATQCVALSRLRDSQLQRGQAVRPLRARASRGRRTVSRRFGGDHRDRLLAERPLGAHGHGCRGRVAPIVPRRCHSPCRPVVPRTHPRLRTVPRPQVRPDPDQGLLPDSGGIRDDCVRAPPAAVPAVRVDGGIRCGTGAVRRTDRGAAASHARPPRGGSRPACRGEGR